MSPSPTQPEPRQATLIDPAQAITEGVLDLPPLDDDPSDGPWPGRPEHLAEEPQPLTGGVVVDGRYQLAVARGRGATATVWEATDLRLDRQVALKVLDAEHRARPEVAERFRREATLAAGLEHPNVVTVLDAGEDAHTSYIAMHLIDGGTLEERLADGAPWSAERVAALGRGVLAGLAHAHDRGLVHRDIKPSNIMFASREDEVPVLTDFGIAKAVLDPSEGLTQVGTILGTAAYLAPEQAMGTGIDHRADLYAVGCVLFQCVTGRKPFSGETPVQMASARVGVQVRPSDHVADVPAWLDEAIATAMAPGRADRFADAGAMIDALQPSAASAAPAATPTEVVPVTSTPDASPATPHAAPQADPHLGPVVSTDVPTRPAEDVASQPSGGWQADERRDATFPLLPTLLIAGITAVLLLVGLLATVGGDGEPDQAVASDPTDAPADTGGQPIAATAQGFDPEGDGSEHSSDAPLVVDGDPATSWETEGYNSAQFGNLKSGVGVLAVASTPAELSAIRVLGVSEGATAEVRVASAGTPSSLADTTVVGTIGGGDHEIDVSGSGPISAVVVWFTSPLPSDGGRHRAGVAEVQMIPAG